MIICLEKLMLNLCDVKAENWALKKLISLPFVLGPLGMSQCGKTRIGRSFQWEPRNLQPSSCRTALILLQSMCVFCRYSPCPLPGVSSHCEGPARGSQDPQPHARDPEVFHSDQRGQAGKRPRWVWVNCRMSVRPHLHFSWHSAEGKKQPKSGIATSRQVLKFYLLLLAGTHLFTQWLVRVS